jgi:hypothetical protein
VDAGYDADHVLMARISLPRNSPEERVTQLLDTVLPRLRATPGVSAAGAGSMMPLMSMTAITSFPLPLDAGPGQADLDALAHLHDHPGLRGGAAPALTRRPIL